MVVELKSVYSGGDIDDTDGAYDCMYIMVDGKKVGDVTVKFWSDDSSLIERIDVDECERGKGIGSEVIRMISSDHESCYIVPDSKRAASLYARLGSESKSEVWMSLDQGFGVYEV